MSDSANREKFLKIGQPFMQLWSNMHVKPQIDKNICYTHTTQRIYTHLSPTAAGCGSDALSGFRSYFDVEF